MSGGVHVALLGAGDRWDNALAEALGAAPDLYFSAAYHAWHHQTGVPLCAVARGDGGAALVVPGLTSAIPGSDGLADLQTPNGYGGPLATIAAEPDFLARAWSAVAEALSARGVIAAFFRLHPLLANETALPSEAVVRVDRQTVYIPLADGPEAALVKADGRHRNMISKARRAGASVVWDDPAHRAPFAALYGAAMERLAAPPSLCFDDAYFAGMWGAPWVHLVALADEAGLVAAAVILLGPRFAHYHLAARRADAPNYAMNLLLHAALERASAAGLEGLHLGGGTTPAVDNPLLVFKRSLGGDTLTFRVARVICDRPRFDELMGRWRASANGAEPTWLLGYRQPAPLSR